MEGPSAHRSKERSVDRSNPCIIGLSLAAHCGAHSAAVPSCFEKMAIML
jgi:hypothetical protein